MSLESVDLKPSTAGIVCLASGYAIRAHGWQMYGPHSYEYHLRQVVATLKQFGITREDLIAAAWLHDVVEDTNATLSSLEAIFPESVTRLVDAVTNQPGVNRKARNETTYVRIREAGVLALTLKLADRIANVRESVATSSNFLGMYRKEHPGFRKALYLPGEIDPMWNCLDDLLGFQGGTV